MADPTLCVLCVRGARPFLPMPCVTAFRPACRSFHFDNKGLFKSILPPPIKNQGVREKFVNTHNSMGFFQGILTKESPHGKKQAPKEFLPQGLHLSRQLPIFTRRFQRTILGTSELNFCVRNGNRWNLTVIVTDQYD